MLDYVFTSWSVRLYPNESNTILPPPPLSLPFQIPLLPCVTAPHQCKYPLYHFIKMPPVDLFLPNLNVLKMPALQFPSVSHPPSPRRLPSVHCCSCCCCCCCSYGLPLSLCLPPPLSLLTLIFFSPFLSHLRVFFLFSSSHPSLALPDSRLAPSQEDVRRRQSRQYAEEEPTPSLRPISHHFLHHLLLLVILAHRPFLWLQEKSPAQKSID